MTSSGLPNQEDQQSKRTSDFSIDHILNKAGRSTGCSSVATPNSAVDFVNFKATSTMPFTWLQCTRYCPPKVPRKREGPQKRQLGRHPRIPFTSHQLALLEERFSKSPYLSSEEVTKLSRILQLADIRVKIWFQNRRARERRERQQPSQLQKSPNLNHQNTTKFNGWSSPIETSAINQDMAAHSSSTLNTSAVFPGSSHDPHLVFKYLIKEENEKL